MGEKKNGYGIRAFKPGTPRGVKVRSVIFFIILLVIIFVQALYWLFANSAEPYVMGMPFGMFFIVLFIGIEFVILLVLYFSEEKGQKKGGGE
jgi:amino acid transporter